MSTNPRKRSRHENDHVDPSKCVICQSESTERTSSTEKGQKTVQDAANIRKDIVYDRLLRINNNNFVYHVTNQCYKAYTHKKSLEILANKIALQNDNVSDKSETKRVFRNDVKPRNKVVFEDHTSSIICIVCGKTKNKGKHDKSRISNSSFARKFLEATISLQDDVYLRTCDLLDEYAVFGATLYYHKCCMINYLRQYENKLTNSFENIGKTSSVRYRVFEQSSSDLYKQLHTEKQIRLSDIRDQLNGVLPMEYSRFNNREIRILMYSKFGEDVCITKTPKSKYTFVTLSSENASSSVHSDDIIKRCAEILREEMMETDFQLNSKFCDAEELRDSWLYSNIPTAWNTFFSTLFHVEQKKSYSYHCVQTGEIDNEVSLDEDSDDDEDDFGNNNIDDCVGYSFEEDNEISERIADKTINPHNAGIKFTRLKALFQVVYFILHNGRKRTPLHIMNAQSIHDKCKSRELITCLNHYGLSISYNELQKYRSDMASFVVKSNEGTVPMPSQFDNSAFTMAAFDNFDHEEATLSGISGSHDTVSVLFQEKTSAIHKKPLMSDMGIIHGSKPFKELLKCQSLLPYTKPVRKPHLQADFDVCEAMMKDETSKEKISRHIDKTWIIARMNLTSTNYANSGLQLVPSWSAFNSLVSQENLKEMRVGFLPVLPFPVTDYQTVYTALRNFGDILKQLDQEHLPVACDEGVYHIAREIIMERPCEFDCIILVLGSFHMAKIFLGCIGRYLKNSGAEHIWVENSVFGPNVVQSVLAVSNYVRSFKGMLLLGEAMERLQLKEFFEEQGISQYETQIEIIGELQVKVNDKDEQGSMQLIERFDASSQQMFEDFNSFRMRKCSESETFQYWDQFIKLIQLLRNLVRADREGNWELHLITVQSILPYFAVFDCVNYIRWCSLYLEDMRLLPKNAPDVYQRFQQQVCCEKNTWKV